MQISVLYAADQLRVMPKSQPRRTSIQTPDAWRRVVRHTADCQLYPCR
ncbi:hypothetical protein HRbin36_01353 [bacterium HR36]|nr:hypothetical protein HRbin36_01353 [bacterium HR36]